MVDPSPHSLQDPWGRKVTGLPIAPDTNSPRLHIAFVPDLRIGFPPFVVQFGGSPGVIGRGLKVFGYMQPSVSKRYGVWVEVLRRSQHGEAVTVTLTTVTIEPPSSVRVVGIPW